MANIFDEDREEPAGAYDEDDLGDFIADEEYDEEDEEGGIDRAQAKRRRLQAQKGTKRGKRKFRGLQSMLDRDAWEEISDIFGTGDEYAWAMELDPTDADVSKKPDLADVRILSLLSCFYH